MPCGPAASTTAGLPAGAAVSEPGLPEPHVPGAVGDRAPVQLGEGCALLPPRAGTWVGARPAVLGLLPADHPRGAALLAAGVSPAAKFEPRLFSIHLDSEFGTASSGGLHW